GVLGDIVPAAALGVQAHRPAGDHAVQAPLGQGGQGPGEVVVERDDGHVGGGVGEVDRVAHSVADDHLEAVELPAEERPDAGPEGDDLLAGLGGEEVVVDLVAQVQRFGRVVVGDHRLGADGQPAGEEVVALAPGLDVHQLPPRGVVGGLQLRGVGDAVDVDPATPV